MAIMAGILAGAECARRRQQRRQLRQAAAAAPDPAAAAAAAPRRSSPSCLFSHTTTAAAAAAAAAAATTTKGNETRHSVIATSQIIRSNYINKELHDWSLGSIAREAKERLDEKLRNQRTSGTKRCNSKRYSMVSIVGALRREVFSCKKSTRRFSWSRLAWNKAAAEAKPDHAATECAVCLEEFRLGDELIHLPCAHRFHRSCAVPWLEISPHCPFCRTYIFSSPR